jgi:pimeloyl-ACP methyl ester carboxylesterase
LPFADLEASPLAPDRSPVRLHYRDSGTGSPVVLLHGGWGYEIYPFDRAIAALAAGHRIVAPDRTGYGKSDDLRAQPDDFHERAALETLALLDNLGIERPVLWGHSDGAVIALRLALAAPGRVRAVVAEATHLFRRKPASRAFFETMRDRPDELGARVTAILERDHGPRWRTLIGMNGDAWLRIGETDGDLYDGRLPRLRVPTLVVHGGRDPRTEPGELDALRDALAASGTDHRVSVLDEGGHSPHSERATADEVARLVASWLGSERVSR